MILVLCLLPTILLSGCAKEKVIVKTKLVEVRQCAVNPVELVDEPAPLVKGESTRKDEWRFAFDNRQALRICNEKLRFINKELEK